MALPTILSSYLVGLQTLQQRIVCVNSDRWHFKGVSGFQHQA